MSEYYQLPTLPYGYDELNPFLSVELLTIHHTKHHQGYVNNTNKLLEDLDGAKNGQEINVKDTLKSLAFNLDGKILHDLFWSNLAPSGKGGEISSDLQMALEQDFGSMDRFKEIFSQAANSVEGSGWAALVYAADIKKLMVTQIEKHNVNLYATLPILMVLDVWEHAYYLDYKNDRGVYVAKFWDFVNWGEVGQRFAKGK